MNSKKLVLKKIDSLCDKVQKQLNRRGAFENYGDKERLELQDYINRFNDISYIEKCDALALYDTKIDLLDYKNNKLWRA